MNPMDEEIAELAYELYEKSGRIEGRDKDNWLEAERIVMLRTQEPSGPADVEISLEDESLAPQDEGRKNERKEIGKRRIRS